jgi:hypothetical protein
MVSLFSVSEFGMIGWGCIRIQCWLCITKNNNCILQYKEFSNGTNGHCLCFTGPYCTHSARHDPFQGWASQTFVMLARSNNQSRIFVRCTMYTNRYVDCVGYELVSGFLPRLCLCGFSPFLEVHAVILACAALFAWWPLDWFASKAWLPQRSLKRGRAGWNYAAYFGTHVIPLGLMSWFIATMIVVQMDTVTTNLHGKNSFSHWVEWLVVEATVALSGPAISWNHPNLGPLRTCSSNKLTPINH